MLKNRKVQIIGTAMLIIAALLVTLSAVRPPSAGFIPVTGSNLEGLAQYQRSERTLAYPAKSNAAGLAIYHLSERNTSAPVKNSLDAYYQSERMQAENWAHSNDPYFKYRQSEWFGR